MQKTKRVLRMRNWKTPSPRSTYITSHTTPPSVHAIRFGRAGNKMMGRVNKGKRSGDGKRGVLDVFDAPGARTHHITSHHITSHHITSHHITQSPNPRCPWASWLICLSLPRRPIPHQRRQMCVLAQTLCALAITHIFAGGGGQVVEGHDDAAQVRALRCDGGMR